MKTEVIVQAVLFGAVVTGAVYLARKIRKDNEEQSGFRGRGRMVSARRRSATVVNPRPFIQPLNQSVGFCANNNPNYGGYFGDLPCRAGYYEVTPESMNFSGADGVRRSSIVSTYATPNWNVG